MNNSLLSYCELVELVKEGVIDAPIDNINGCSIDITLDNEIEVEGGSIRDITASINLGLKESIHTIKHKMSPYGYGIIPGQFILASSVEVFNLPNNIAAEYKLKSTLARNGLNHMLAGWCDPGWSNSKLTLELHNVTRSNVLIISPGMKIGQMVFWRCNPVPSEVAYDKVGQYNNQQTVTPSKGLR